MDYDTVTQALIPVDLTGATVTCNVFKAVQELQDDGSSFIEEGFATDLPCELLSSDEGWIQVNFATGLIEDPARLRIEFVVITDEYERVYPRFADQWVSVK
jgi:hypothetical protein